MDIFKRTAPKAEITHDVDRGATQEAKPTSETVDMRLTPLDARVIACLAKPDPWPRQTGGARPLDDVPVGWSADGWRNRLAALGKI